MLNRNMGHLVQLHFKSFISVVALLPLSAFVFCIIWSILFNYEEVTSTHCHVRNFLPSVSTSVGAYSPQKYVWRMSIALHSTPRFLISLMYYNYFSQLFPSESHWQRLIFACYFLQNAEIFCLIGLTYISSSEDFPLHQKFFVAFVICALLSMFLLFLIYKNRLHRHQSRLRRKSARLKLLLLVINLVAFCFSVYFYFRHNWYCEPGLYSLFALAEYIVVLSNIGYHFTAGYDFLNEYIIVSTL